MKSKKLFLPVIILIAAVFTMILCSVVSVIAKKPTVTEQEFPFSITYELNGETKTIQDVYAVRYYKNEKYSNTKTRYYIGKIGDMSEDTTHYILKSDKNGRIELNTKFYPDYMMGDTKYDYFGDEAFGPEILYYDAEENVYTDEETLLAQGVKLIDFKYPAPIKNSFVFSHIAELDIDAMFPTIIVGLLAFLVTVIFVKKEKDFVKKPIDVVSVVFNFLVCFVALPISVFIPMLIDALGGSEGILGQVLYFVPAMTILGVAASIALRRKGYGKSALVAEFIGPAVFMTDLIIADAVGVL